MRRALLLLSCIASLSACGSSGARGATDAGGEGARDTGGHVLDAPGTDRAVSACLPGETACASACIAGTDCSHAVTAQPSANVWVNGGTFVELALGAAGDVTGVKVADAVVGFRAPDGAHLWIEIPPGASGPADVTLKVAGGSVTTKRALTYASGPEGTTWTTKTMATARGGFPAMATTFDDRASSRVATRHRW